jgi:hypothetical protein
MGSSHMYIIYKTTNSVNGKIYIGMHKQETDEFDGYLGSGLLLKKAMSKYGRDVFTRETLAVCETKEVAAITEKALIEQYDSRNPDIGYNITEGGIGGDVTATHPNREEILEKKRQYVLSQMAAGKWINPLDRHPETRLHHKILMQQLAKTHPERWNHVRGPETEDEKRRRLATFAANKQAGLHQDEAITSANISAAQKKRFAEHPETHGMKGRKHTEESRRKLSQTRKERLAAGIIQPPKPNTDLISGKNNYQFKGWYITPWGTFPTIRDACRDQHAGITDMTTFRKIYSNLDIKASARCVNKFNGVKGNTWRDLGFNFVEDV